MIIDKTQSYISITMEALSAIYQDYGFD